MNNKSINNIDVMETLFNTSDMLKGDFRRCGKNIKEAGKHFKIKVFYHTENYIRCIYGLKTKTVKDILVKGGKTLKLDSLDYFSKGKKVLIYNIENNVYEFNRIKDIIENMLIFSDCLQNDYPIGSSIVSIRQIDYKRHPIRQILKRRIDNGKFQTLAKKVTGLYITHFDESLNIFYTLIINDGANIRGYVYLLAMV